MTTQLLLIDPQNDFCDVPPWILANPGNSQPALPVTGAWEDMKRVGELVDTHGDRFGAITVTLDSHPLLAIERPLFWESAAGEPVAPFTVISAQDMREGRFRPAVKELQGDDRVFNLLSMLESQGKPGVMVWPAHCTIGTWGHQVVEPVDRALERWTSQLRRFIQYVHKGTSPMTEHFGAFEADVPLADAPETQFNHSLAKRLLAADTLLVAGEASSHCVAASVRQLLAKAPQAASRIVLLTDCMSPVTGFEAQADAFLEEAASCGVRLMTTAEWAKGA